ncbi:unnamed protein product [Medioppia subpectinata]|uniref:Fucosyltransferase n=1 Tax=Medioppia subpectinata TaxID=1979941 RepID=A0A7R9KFN7_9ACAR|nr:unnamed protein product [Medioppia subpectinata]CAG2101470.1 unnamed protein product [Medioppia subpectinata]
MDRSLVVSADAVFFHWRDTSPWDLPAKSPSAAARGQKWVLYNWEPPQYAPAFRVRPLAEHIDWVMSYRRDSDIYVPYGSVTKCDTKWQNENLFDNKSGSVAWIVSNCQSPGNRETYVNDLRKHIDIDIYGMCGQHDCPRDGTCLSAIVKKYKFYLSFENSLCKDYVTEKLFKIISYDIIPVVYGSADYSLIMPNNSFINVKDFNTTEDLAKYLKLVSSDKQMAKHIDWVMSYRRDSDIYVPYGSVTKCDTKWQNEDLFDNKSGSVAWIVSNCHTSGNRETYVNDLRKHIDIDIFGMCGQYNCPRDGTCLSAIVKKYKFYLSFENSLCKDYVTEKLFNMVQYDIIPVVYGSADYSLIMPNNSFINVKDFNTTEDLAKYLKLVSSDKQLYNSYMLWKNSYCPQMTHSKYFCHLCHKLNEDSARKPTNRWNRKDVVEWFIDGADCRRPTFNSNSSLRPISSKYSGIKTSKIGREPGIKSSNSGKFGN